MNDEVDPPYLVPSHLREHQSIGPIPVRAFFVVLGAGMLLGAPVATLGREFFQSEGGLWLGVLPIMLAIPFALPWLDPPAEHGAVSLVKFWASKVWRNCTWTRWPPRPELAEADGLLAFLRVLNAYRRRETLGLDEQPDLAGLDVADGVITSTNLGVRALYRVPTVNLDTASAMTRRGARAQWGAIVNALPHPIQVVVRGTPATTLPVLERIKAHGSPQALDLAAWLGAHLHGAQLVERERFLVVPAEDLETLQDRCSALEASMRRIGLPLERIGDSEALQAVLGGFLTQRHTPRGAHLGPATVAMGASDRLSEDAELVRSEISQIVKSPGRTRPTWPRNVGRAQHLGPAIVDISASDRLLVDGEQVRAFDLGKMPPTITTDWMAPLLDGDLPLDCSIDIEPLDLTWAKLALDRRRNALESSAPTPGRTVALEQIAGLRMAYERRQTLPMRMAVSLVVRGQDRATLERRTKRLQQRCKDLGAELRTMRWEQRAGWLAVLPVRRRPLERRGLPVETGTVARTYPFAAGTLVVEGGVPFGVAAAAPVTFTTAHARAKNRHMCWYGTSGAGKGYSLRVLLSRERFANGLRIYGIDQDEQQEYAGRFCDYLGGSRVPIRTVEDAEAFDLQRVVNPDVVIWDLHDSDEHDRGAILATLKRKLVEHMLATPGRAAFIVDEAVTVTEDDLGARTLGDLVRRGRHFGLEVHVLTQRVSDWFDTRIGRTIQSVAASKWFGQMEARELYEIAPSLGITPEERDRLEKAGQGEGLLVTAGRRVWVNLYGHTSPAEFAMANTDVLVDLDKTERTSDFGRRNGHARETTTVAAWR